MNLSEYMETKGTYVGIRLDEESKDQLVALQAVLRLKNPLSPEKFHATVLYSRKHIDVQALSDAIYHGVSTRVETWDAHDGKKIVVLKFDCPELTQRHEDLIDIGGTSDYPDYKPHITLSYDDDIFPIDCSIDLTLINEYVEELDLEWKDD